MEAETENFSLFGFLFSAQLTPSERKKQFNPLWIHVLCPLYGPYIANINSANAESGVDAATEHLTEVLGDTERRIEKSMDLKIGKIDTKLEELTEAIKEIKKNLPSKKGS